MGEKIKTGQMRVGLAHDGFRAIIYNYGMAKKSRQMWELPEISCP